MRLIAHRGNFQGINKEQENSPEYLIEAIRNGYDVEVDTWVIDNVFYFGHDEPQYIISVKDFYSIIDHAWFHCKNIDALKYFISHMPTARYFWHQEDDYTLTSNNYIWTYPEKNISKQSIIVHLEKPTQEYLDNFNGYGICSDYVGHI